jgi:UDP:flavonoid glycosyltransferase YjiC (YdhE family)
VHRLSLPLSLPIDLSLRGDVQPFVQLGLRLRRDGHLVRLATHSCFEDYVRGVGLDFYPLAGDPLKLSEFMVCRVLSVGPNRLSRLLSA